MMPANVNDRGGQNQMGGVAHGVGTKGLTLYVATHCFADCQWGLGFFCLARILDSARGRLEARSFRVRPAAEGVGPLGPAAAVPGAGPHPLSAGRGVVGIGSGPDPIS